MRFLVVSDTHENFIRLKSVISKHSTINTLIHLGDGETDVRKARSSFTRLNIIKVKGNCDIDPDSPLFEELEIEGKKLFITHGHLFRVKSGTETISIAAKKRNADIVMFGHTHEAMNFFNDGIQFINPGSLAYERGSYSIVDITSDKVDVYMKSYYS